ncbi:MAG: ThiF family adenylyltransferase [Deltaproteobacteria bacterium]|nr:ThiF family adenylyltransferase [Deltaproteobacteria bacterium]
MGQQEDYFARVAPLLGRGLAGRLLAFRRPRLTGRLLELLFSCRLDRAVLEGPDEPAGWPLDRLMRPASGARATARLLAYLEWKNRFAPLRVLPPGQAAELRVDARLLPDGQAPHLVFDPRGPACCLRLLPGDPWSLLDLSYAAAHRIRDFLLGRAPLPDRPVYVGNHLWPFAETDRAVSAPQSCPLPSSARIAVVGCGSVGSELVRLLDGPGIEWQLVDGAKVSVFNPMRQYFGSAEIGQPKVEALAERLGRERVTGHRIRLGADRLHLLDAWLQAQRPDLVVLAAGTADHGPLASRLWRARVPHLAVCAYAQARAFEIACVLPGEGTPCLHCFRGRLFAGPASAPVVDDELAAFLYQRLDARSRERLYVDLVAEPAGYIETGRVAAVAARCAAEMLRPAAERGLWFRRMLGASTTCLLGGNAVDRSQSGAHAYGLRYTGQVVRLGVEDLAGSEEQTRCAVCGRSLDIRHRLDLPETPDAEVDLALLAG